MNSKKALLLDVEANRKATLRQLLQAHHFEVLDAEDHREASELLESQVDVVIGEFDSEASVSWLKSQLARTPHTLFVADLGDEHDVLALLEAGVDQVAWPGIEDDVLLALINGGLQTKQREAVFAKLEQRLNEKHSFDQLVAQSPATSELAEAARAAAASQRPVLLIGEVGSGKQFWAEVIHQNSSRRQGPFVVVTAEELGGEDHPQFDRHIDSAVGGSLFIRGGRKLDRTTQRRLLEYLDQQIAEQLAGDPQPAHPRIFVADRHSLKEGVQSGDFREDLYRQLCRHELIIPPLRERPEDIPLLVGRLVSAICRQQGRAPLTVSKEVRSQLEGFNWPGNVRQLRDCLEAMVSLARGDELTLDELPMHISNNHSNGRRVTIPPGTKLEELEREAVEQTLQRHEGNRTHTAAALGISVRTLQRKLKQWGLHYPR